MEVGDSVVTLSKEVKNLGVIFDQSLTYRSYTMAVSRGAYFQLYNIQKARPHLTDDAAATAINDFVATRLDYANALLYGLPKCVLYNLQKIQNSAARTLTGIKRREHITPVLKDLHWLPIKRRIEYKILTLMFKVKMGLAPRYISELVHIYDPVRRLCSIVDHKFMEVPTQLKTGGDRAFQKAGPVLWNSLPANIRSSPSLTTFKKALKTYLFRLEYGC